MTANPIESQSLLGIWRAAAQHAPLAETLPHIAALIGRIVPADFLVVRPLDAAASRFETPTVAAIRPGALPPLRRHDLTQGELESVLAWCRAGQTPLVRQAQDPLTRLAVGPTTFAAAIAGPLGTEHAPAGVFALVSRVPHALTAAHEAIGETLVAALTVALTNDLRLQEFARLREALEADKRALLQKLDRDHLSEAIIGADSGLRRVMERVEQVAATDVPVLLLGETGSGKEVVARAIHERSRRATAPVLRVNCGAMPAGLIDSELFGHERGSFTGAVSSRKGWFERADGGTLFLDEVAELPLDAQVKLLRILQDGTFERVGGQRTQSADVRIVAATHRNLREMVSRRTFREDLWYRLGVFPIEIPALRERPEDIPALAMHFAARAGVRLQGGPLSIDPDDIERLVAYPWPGNVRELSAVIERAAILGDGRRLRVSAALGGAASATTMSERPTDLTSTAGDALALLPKEALVTLDEAMIRHIELALRATGGRIEGPQGAAAVLRINPHTLRARMRKLRIEWREFRHGGSDGTGSRRW